MSDYADWTESIELLGTEIMVPMDFQGATIMVPLDFQGATIMMPMDIQGQTINLAVDIVAQTIGSIAIDISAQSIGNLTISVAAQSVGVYLQPEWAAKQQVDKDFSNTGVLAAGVALETYYTVPAGKTLFITSFGCGVIANTAADRDTPNFTTIKVISGTTGKATIGGNGGCGMVLSKPIRIPAGVELDVSAQNGSDHEVTLTVSFHGYEI